MSAKDIEQIGDVVNGTKYASGPAQDEYYKFMLLKEKLKLSRPDGTTREQGVSAQAIKILGATSERDEIELKILEKLTNITESSPEFAQIVDITGSKDRYEQAKRLAETVYDRVRSEEILKMYTPSAATLQSHFKNRTIQAAVERTEAIANIPGVLNGGVSASLAAALGRITGLGLGGTAS